MAEGLRRRGEEGLSGTVVGCGGLGRRGGADGGSIEAGRVAWVRKFWPVEAELGVLRLDSEGGL